MSPSPAIRPYEVSPFVASREVSDGLVVDTWRHWSFAGVYAIAIDSGGTYVGSSLNIASRISRHLAALRQGKHHNRRLRFAVAKHGPSCLRFRLLEAISRASRGSLEAAEQRHIDATIDVINAARKAVVPPEHRMGLAARKTLAAKRRQAWKDPVYRARVCSALNSTDISARQSVLSRERWLDKTYRARTVKQFCKAQSRRRIRKLHSDTAKILWRRWKTGSDPHKTVEFREKRRRQLNALWADLKWRARASRAISKANRRRRGERRPAQSVAMRRYYEKRRADVSTNSPL